MISSTTLNFKSNQDLNIRPHTQKLLESRGVSANHIVSTNKDLWNRTVLVQRRRWMVGYSDLRKLKSSFKRKEQEKRKERNCHLRKAADHRMWVNPYQQYFCQSNSIQKKQRTQKKERNLLARERKNNPIKRWNREMNRWFSKEKNTNGYLCFLAFVNLTQT